MPQKPSAKIEDVKRPEKVAPAATSRPILVSNRSVLTNDPMVVPTTDQTEAPKPAEPITRTAKTIQPVSDGLKADTEEPAEAAQPAEPAPLTPETPAEPALEPPTEPTPGAPTTSEASPAASVPEEAKKAEEETPVAVITQPTQPGPVPDARVSADAPADTKPAPEQSALPSTPDEDPGRDPQAEANAEATAAEEARQAREQQLEQLVASGKYFVPIDAVQRKRSRIFAVLLLVLALGLGAVLADAALDAGLVNAPMNIPHTHFFSSH